LDNVQKEAAFFQDYFPDAADDFTGVASGADEGEDARRDTGVSLKQEHLSLTQWLTE
jgi:hypothetical protein